MLDPNFIALFAIEKASKSHIENCETRSFPFAKRKSLAYLSFFAQVRACSCSVRVHRSATNKAEAAPHIKLCTI